MMWTGVPTVHRGPRQARGTRRWGRMRSITGGSKTAAMIRMGAPHRGHKSGRHS